MEFGPPLLVEMYGKGRCVVKAVTGQLVFLIALFISFAARADVMTVGQLRDMVQSGGAGELAAVAYVNGAVDGMVGLDFLHQKERGSKPEFCKFRDARLRGKPLPHPAYRTKELLAAWEKQGQSMDTPAVDFVLAFLSAQYGCAK